MEEEGREIPTITAGGEEDRISALPGEIIHHILARLRSPEQPAKATVLSKRWTDIWRSYPILEFDDGILKSYESFAAAATAKFSDQKQSSSPLAADAVRIRFECSPPRLCSAIIDDLLPLAAKSLPREIDLQYSCFDYKPYIIPALALLPPPHSISRLRVLKLRNCGFHPEIINAVTGEKKQGSSSTNNPFAGLRELCFRTMRLDEGFLSSIIAAAAPNLESLTLIEIRGIQTLRIRNLPNLKILRVENFRLENLEISEVNSLETLDLRGGPLAGGVEVSNSLPNLKVLRLANPHGLTDQKFDKLISKSPSLESLILSHPSGVLSRKLKIVNNDKLREFKLKIRATDLPVNIAMEIDVAPTTKACNFHYNGPINLCPRIVMAGRDAAPAPSFYWELHGVDDHTDNFRQCLERLCSQFRVTLQFCFLPCWNAVENKLPIRRIEHVIFKQYSTNINDFFQICHPKYLSFTCQKSLSSDLEYIKKYFKGRDFIDCCTTACKCWRHQLIDAKIVKRATNSNSNIENEGAEMVEVSTDMFHPIQKQHKFCFY